MDVHHGHGPHDMRIICLIMCYLAGYKTISVQTASKVGIISRLYETSHLNQRVLPLTLWFISSSVEGLHAIVVTDRDGVPVIKGTMPHHVFSSMFQMNVQSTQPHV